MRIVFTGGGTGGHIIPFAPIIEALRRYHIEHKDSLPAHLEPSNLDMTFMGVATKEARELFETYDVRVRHIPSGKLRRYASGLTIIDLLFRLPVGVLRALITLWRIMPDVVISKGGYGSLPTVLAAAFFRIPVLLHESDAVPGVSTTFLARFATAIALGYTAAASRLNAYKRKSIVTGNPVRPELRRLSQAEGKRSFGIAESEFVLLVFGGSQGAKQLNEVLLASLPRLIPDMTIIHVAGPDHLPAVKTVASELLAQSSRRQAYHVYGYLSYNMLAALAAADVIVTRAGSSLAEIAAARKPALIIPLDSAAGDHQRKNAQVFEAAGAALVLDPTNVGQNLFEQNVRRLHDDEALRREMIANLAQLDFPNAAHDIASLAFSLAQGLQPRT